MNWPGWKYPQTALPRKFGTPPAPKSGSRRRYVPHGGRRQASMSPRATDITPGQPDRDHGGHDRDVSNSKERRRQPAEPEYAPQRPNPCPRSGSARSAARVITSRTGGSRVVLSALQPALADRKRVQEHQARFPRGDILERLPCTAVLSRVRGVAVQHSTAHRLPTEIGRRRRDRLRARVDSGRICRVGFLNIVTV